jgi:hypothetical protein
MKLAKWLLLVGSAIVMMAGGCNEPVSAPVGVPRDAVTFPIVNDQNSAVGRVEVWNDADYLYVRFAMDDYGDWYLAETRVTVATDYYGLPQSRTGDPNLGDFAYRTTHKNVKTYTHAIPDGYALDQVLAIATHCSVVRVVEGKVGRPETGFSGNRDFAGAKSARWFEYPIKTEDTKHEGTATGWAGDSARGLGQGNRWYRWTEYTVGGSAVEVPMYAGQSNRCGTLNIWETPGYIHVRFACSGEAYGVDYEWTGFNVTHLNVAADQAAAFLDGIAAPGQFDYGTDHIPRRMSYVYDVPNIWPSGTRLYIFAHADVAYALPVK